MQGCPQVVQPEGQGLKLRLHNLSAVPTENVQLKQTGIPVCLFVLACEMKISMKFAITCYRTNLLSSLCSIFGSFIDLWVKKRAQEQRVCTKLNPVQSSRSKKTTYSKKGRLFRFKSNRTATSDGCTMEQRKNLETMSGMFLNHLQTNLQPNQLQIKYNV